VFLVRGPEVLSGTVLSASWEAIEETPPRIERTPQAVLKVLLDELDRGGRLPRTLADPERAGVPADVLEALRIVSGREGFTLPRVVRIFVALLVERYADEIGRPAVPAITRDTFRLGAHGMLREVLEPMLGWGLGVTA